MKPLFALRRWLVVALLLTLALARPASALTNADWVKRVYADALLRQPTANELAAALATLGAGQTRIQVAYSFLTSAEAYQNLLGADPLKPGYFQALLARNPTVLEIVYFNCLRSQNAQDEAIIAILIGGQSSASACQPPGQTSAEYEARAIANNSGLAICGRQEVVIDQIYLDLLGRHATTVELQATVAATLAAILDPLSSASTADEYRTRVVRTAFLRFLHRLPNNSEAAYYLNVLASEQGLGDFGDEMLQALLVASAEYGGGGSTTFDSSALASLPPLFASPLMLALNYSVVSLSNQVLSDEQTIQALTLANFGAAPTAAAASAELDLAALEAGQVRAILQSQCTPDVRCAFVDPRQLQLAEAALQDGLDELGRGESSAAARDARFAYDHAILALKNGSR